jgi:hypothetical protein
MRPRAIFTSLKHTPHASTSSSACPGASAGSGSSRGASGAPYWVTTIAFTQFLRSEAALLDGRTLAPLTPTGNRAAVLLLVAP